MASSTRPAAPPRRPRSRREKASAEIADSPAVEVSEAARYKAVVEQSHDLLMIVGTDQRMRLCNAAFERTLGYPVESLVGAEFMPLVHEDDRPALLETIRALDLVPGAAVSVDFRLRAADGSWHFMQTSATNLLDAPAVRGIVVSLRDMTEKVLVAGALKTSEERYQDLIDRAQEVVYEADVENGRFTSINAAGQALTGYSIDELLTMGMYDLVAPEEREHALELVEHVVQGTEDTIAVQLQTKDGRRVFLEASAHRVSRNGGPTHIEGIARDVTERHALEERLRYEAIHDALTGLANRTLLLDRLGVALARRDGRCKVAVMLLDIDDFKLVNDDLGHAAGDEVLIALATRLRSTLRKGETVARLGGDEFALVTETARAKAGLVALAQRTLSAFAEPFAAAGVQRKLSGSLGIAVAHDGSTPAELLRDADTAMYRAKAVYNGGFAFFDSAMREQFLAQSVLLVARGALREALADRAAAHARGGGARRSKGGVGVPDGSPVAVSTEARLRAIVEQSYDLLVIVDGEHRLRWTNEAFDRALGYSPEALVGMDALSLVHGDDVSAFVEAGRLVSRKPGMKGAVSVRLRAADGSWRFVEMSATNLLHEPAIAGFVVSLRDVTDRARVEGALRTSEERYQELVDRTHEAVYTMTLDGTFASVNRAAAELTGYSVEELLAMSLFDLVAPEQREHAAEVLARRGRSDGRGVELQLQAKDGRRLFAESFAHMVERNGGPAHIEGIARDVTERHLLEERLRYEAIHDALTGLPNRTLLFDRLGQALARRRDGRIEVAVMLLDINEFSLVNDELGHAAGDEVLAELATRCRSTLREGEMVARFGGDKFAVVVENNAGKPGLLALAERVLSAFEEPFIAAGLARVLTGSLGIAVATEGSTPAQLLRDADTAVHRVDATRSEDFAFFDGSMRDKLVQENAVREALVDALHGNQLEVHYQPIVSLADNTLLAVEALVRWPHPDWGWVAPDDFIPLAEQSGLIVDLGRYVLDETARQAARWRTQNPGALPLGVFVNVSPRELADPGFAAHVTETLRKHRLNTSDLAFELTERVFIDTDDDTVVRNLDSLAATGIRLVLDDFGTGYSALSSLDRFPFAALKIDRSFISAIETPDSDAHITKAIISLGKSLGIAVIAEGIETDTQLDYVRNLDCTAAQGYKLARPQPAADISTLFGPAAPSERRNHTN